MELTMARPVGSAHGSRSGDDSWRARALCAGSQHVWVFMEIITFDAAIAARGGQRKSRDHTAFETIARVVCDQCPVETECRDYARANREAWGMWGGESASERRIELNNRRRGRRA